MAASSAPDRARSSTQRCRGSGNMAAQESRTAGLRLAW